MAQSQAFRHLLRRTSISPADLPTPGSELSPFFSRATAQIYFLSALTVAAPSSPFSADAATLQTCSTPALAPQNSSAEVRLGFAAETPIVIDDVDTVGPSTGSLTGRREAGPDHVSGNAGGVDVPGWLEQQNTKMAKEMARQINSHQISR